MKTQISRDGFRPEQRYSGVYQQQGRMLTDRDWNEMVDVLKTRIDDGLADALGTGLPHGRELRIIQTPAGAPIFAPGLVWAGGTAARISSVEGGESQFGLSQQADFPSPPPPPVGQSYVLYADVWERPVLALEDGDLRDPALTGPYDTSTRQRTIGQVKWAPLDRDPENPAHNPTRGNAPLSLRVPSTAPAASDNFLFRVEIHDVTWSAGAAPEAPSSIVVKWSRENGARQFRYPEAPAWFQSSPPHGRPTAMRSPSSGAGTAIASSTRRTASGPSPPPARPTIRRKPRRERRSRSRAECSS
jgi:hypothetical protein